jgi:putative transposase
MPRTERTDVGGYVYHVLNRANAKVQIFDNDQDYKLFETVLEEAKERMDMRVLTYCVMPNHWHLVIYPRSDGDIQKFMHWLTMTHTQRWHAIKNTTGQGHLYQGRYKSFVIQEDKHFLTLVRYVERNALKANLVRKAENWKWSGVWRRENGTEEQKKLLSEWPVPRPTRYLNWLNEAQTQSEEDEIEQSVQKGRPYGIDSWVRQIVKKFGLESTVRSRGRPQKGS